VSGKFADFKRQQVGHIVDIAESSPPVRSQSAALPQLSSPPSNGDPAWYAEDGSRDLLKRMGYRDEYDDSEDNTESLEVLEEDRAQGRIAEDATEDEDSEYEDYVEDDGKNF
jgi:hypothetical protein